ncbi:MAG: cytochrome c [Acidobacteria bacterium]|nr:cytochrome c [Acidobacteriota bacterium]
MSRRHLLAATLALVLALVAGTILVSRLSTSVREADTPPARRGGQPPTIGVTANMLQHGQVLYRDHCSSCHGSNGQADGPLSGSMSPNPRDQTSRAIMDRVPDTEIARRVQTGVGQMPANPQLRGEDLVALVAFVRSLSRPDVRVVELQALAQGTVADFVPVTAEMLRTPAADDWVMMRADVRLLGVQPARSDQPRQRLEAAAGVGPSDGARRPVHHAARARRRNVPPAPR